MYMCVCRFLVVSRRRRLKASSLSLMWQEYWQGHTDEEEEIFIRNALAMGRLMTWDWLQHYHYPPEIQPIKVRTLQSPHATIHLIFHHSFGCKLRKCSVSFHRNCFERFTDWIPPPCALELDAGKVLLWSLVMYPLNDKNPIAVLTFLISCLWLDRVCEGSGGRDESVEDSLQMKAWKAEGFPLQRERIRSLVTECRQETISADISAPAGHTQTHIRRAEQM